MVCVKCSVQETLKYLFTGKVYVLLIVAQDIWEIWRAATRTVVAGTMTMLAWYVIALVSKRKRAFFLDSSLL